MAKPPHSPVANAKVKKVKVKRPKFRRRQEGEPGT